MFDRDCLNLFCNYFVLFFILFLDLQKCLPILAQLSTSIQLLLLLLDLLNFTGMVPRQKYVLSCRSKAGVDEPTQCLLGPLDLLRNTQPQPPNPTSPPNPWLKTPRAWETDSTDSAKCKTTRASCRTSSSRSSMHGTFSFYIWTYNIPTAAGRGCRGYATISSPPEGGTGVKVVNRLRRWPLAEKNAALQELEEAGGPTGGLLCVSKVVNTFGSYEPSVSVQAALLLMASALPAAKAPHVRSCFTGLFKVESRSSLSAY